MGQIIDKKKVLITGPNGFIGKNIIKGLKKKIKFTKISRQSPNKITNFQSLLKLNGMDAVIHCAARTYVPDSYKNPFDFYKFNIISTLNIAEYCRKKKIEKLIYINAYPYGSPKYLPVDENHILKPHSPYNSSKTIAENILINYLDGITKVISLRVFNVYGLYQSSNFLIPKIISQVKNENIISLNDLRPKRDFLYIKDLVRLLEIILENKTGSGYFNVGSGKSYQITDIINIVSKMEDKICQVTNLKNYRNSEILDLYADIRKVSKTFGWKPIYSLERGLTDYLLELKNL